jgi:sterol desaturase/sphingolipid hydroxylase (fatty acid hydroxylase superfamily)
MTRDELGKIPAALALWLGLGALGAVLCIHAPTWLATAGVRELVPVAWVRVATRIALVLAVGLGTWAVVRQRSKVAAVGLVGAGLAWALGGAQVKEGVSLEGRGLLGLDWLVVDALLCALVFIPLEKRFARLAGPTRRESWRLDLSYSVLNHLSVHFLSLAGLLLSVGVAHACGLTPEASPVHHWPLWLQVPALLLLADLVEYVLHRAMHEVPWLWRVHAVHHSTQKLDVLAGSRVHLVETLVTRAGVTLAFSLAGFGFGAVLLYGACITVQATLIHANVRFDYGWLEQVLVSPRFHHWHHASDDEAIDTNYAGTFSFLDRLFGTWHLPQARWPKKFGVVAEVVPETFLGQLAFPFTR